MRGFTLIELLVVVTIIVVLLALLAPAMDQAIYRTELTVCATKLKAVGSGAILYTYDNKRRYPHRPGVIRGSFQTTTLFHATPKADAPQGDDDRPSIKPYIPLNKLLNCPLNGQIELEDTRPRVTVCGSYNMFPGWQYRGERGMFRLGDRWTWTEPGQPSYALDVLATDRDAIAPLEPWVRGTHLDKSDVTFHTAFEGDNSQSSRGVPDNVILDAAGQTIYIAEWKNLTTHHRGFIDLNSVRQDGSVQTYNNVDYEGDDRMIRPTLYSSKGEPTWTVAVPKQ